MLSQLVTRVWNVVLELYLVVHKRNHRGNVQTQKQTIKLIVTCYESLNASERLGLPTVATAESQRPRFVEVKKSRSREKTPVFESCVHANYCL